MPDQRDTLHKIRNHLGTLQTFLESLRPSELREKLRGLHQTCIKDLETIKKTLQDLENR